MKTPLRQLLFGVACVPLLIACNKEPVVVKDYPRPIKVVQVDLIKGPTTRILKGEVQPSEHAVLSFRVPGEIHNMKVRAGDHVKQGDIIVSLDPATYQQEVEMAKADFELARVLYKRAKQLVADNFISKNDFDKSKSNYITAKSFLKTQQNRLDYTELRAPYDGVISTRYAREYEFVAEKQNIVGFQGKTNVDILFQLPEQYIAPFQRQRDQGAEAAALAVKFDGREEWYEATIKELSTVADSSTASYSVVATLNKPSGFNALSGMAAEIRVNLPSSGANKKTLPKGSILVEDEKQYLFRWLSEDKKVEKVAVEIEDGIVISGLNDGDWIVAAGVNELTDGQAVMQWVKERGL